MISRTDSTAMDDAHTDPAREAIASRLATRVRRVICDEGLRTAAVLVLLLPSGPGWSVLLTRRTDQVELHKGEICFPGGKVDEGDVDHMHTALRETREEVGICPEHVSVLGPLDDFVSVSGYRVRPFVALLDRSDYTFRAAPREVAEILVVPVAHLLRPTNHKMIADGAGSTVHQFFWNGHVVWGMTAAILDHFLRVAESAGVGQ